MKYKYSIRTIGALAFLPFLITSTALADGKGLIPNSSMEQDSDGDQWPDQWPKLKLGGSWEKENGNHFIRMTSTEPGQLIMLYMEIKIPDGTKNLKLTWKQRVTGLKKGPESWFDARIMMDWLTNNSWLGGKKLPGSKTSSCGKDTNGWEDKSLDLTVPEGAKVLKFMPSLFRVTSGTYDLDDLQLTPVN